MKKKLDTFQLEFDKSGFLIDLLEHDTGQLCIEIIQTIFDSKEKAESIKINPSVLSDLIRVLKTYQDRLPQVSNLENKYITEYDQYVMKNSYLKGVPVEDLAMLYGYTPEIIKMILRNKGLKIVENKMSKSFFAKRRYKRKR
ncbi:MAG: hypothetical protein ACPG4W_06170 [Flavobacteriales bacterium]